MAYSFHIFSKRLGPYKWKCKGMNFDEHYDFKPMCQMKTDIWNANIFCNSAPDKKEQSKEKWFANLFFQRHEVWRCKNPQLSFKLNRGFLEKTNGNPWWICTIFSRRAWCFIWYQIIWLYLIGKIKKKILHCLETKWKIFWTKVLLVIINSSRITQHSPLAVLLRIFSEMRWNITFLIILFFQFHLPGSQILFVPKLFITVLAYSPLVYSLANQVSFYIWHFDTCLIFLYHW